MRSAFFLPVLLLVACDGGGSSSAGDDAGGDDAPGDIDAGSGGGSGDDAGTPSADEAVIPAPTGTCPTLRNGAVTFAPAGMPARSVTLALPAEGTPAGPLYLYWHATGSAPAEAAYALGTTLSEITAAGGVVASPSSDSTAGTFEWFIVNQSARLDDFILADEIVACLVAANRVDPSRIHSMGMSAGALQTTAMSFLRSNYIASVVTYSGGLPSGFTTPPAQNASNKLAAMIFDGGAGDAVFGVNFQAASDTYATRLETDGHFVARCDHGGGHTIPRDAAPSVRTFFAAHPFGTSPSPYAGGLPASFPAYCE